MDTDAPSDPNIDPSGVYATSLRALNAILGTIAHGSFDPPANQAAWNVYSGARDKISAGYDLALSTGDEPLRISAGNAMQALAANAERELTPENIRKANLGAIDDAAAKFGVTWFGGGATSAPGLEGSLHWPDWLPNLSFTNVAIGLIVVVVGYHYLSKG